MSREIKFRAWDKKNKRMLFEGLFLDQADANELSWPTGAFGEVPRDFNPREVEIMQYTGLKDKNGKEIYEGDIVQWSYRRGVVEFFYDRFRCTWLERNATWPHNKTGSCMFGHVQYICVIGNIHENPEILK